MSPVRIGVVGSARIGTFHTLTLSRRVPEAALIGVADRAIAAAEASA